MIKENYNLQELSTFNIGGPAQYYAQVETQQQLIEAVEYAKQNNLNITVLGSASNVIISDEGIKGLVIRLANTNIEQTENTLTAGAGLIWDDFVEYSVKLGLYGIENLSLIPGTVGASAVQNIGAYGQEVAETIKTVYALDTQTMQFVKLSNKECEFAYRKSIFNSTEKGRYIIYKISYQLNDNDEFSLGYQDMAYFRDDSDLSLDKIRSEIIKIRTNKLPDYNVLPNVGSFFKNLVLEKSEFTNLVEKAKDVDAQKAEKLKSFETSRDTVKVPTALLIDLCGLKGYKAENIGIYEKHALIVINHSKKGTCQDVLDFTKFVQNSIYDKLGVMIYPEPTVIN